MVKTTVRLTYGILSEPINIQLDLQGFKYDKEQIKVYEMEREAINTLRFGSGLLTESTIDKLLIKLHKKIVNHVAKRNKEKVLNI